MNVDPQLAPVLAERARRLARPMTDSSEMPTSTGLLRFVVGNEAFAVASDAVAEVQPAPRPAPLPAVPPWLAGMIGLHGRILPAIWLDRFFGGASGEFDSSADRVVVVQANSVLLALLAMTVEGTFVASAVEPDPLPAGISSAALECALGVDGRYLVLDAARLVDTIGASLGSSRSGVQPPLIQADHGEPHANRT